MNSLDRTRILPWHHAIWQQLCQLLKHRQLPHTLLIQAPSKSGKQLFITEFAKTVLCQRKQNDEENTVLVSCNNCSSCLWFENGTHPDYHALNCLSQDKTTPVSIENIRTLLNSLHHKSLSHSTLQSYSKVVVIHSVEALQAAGVNALLKVTEEPPNAVLFLLSSHNVQKVIPTLRSRCRLFVLPTPTVQHGAQWILKQYPKDDVNIPDMQAIESSLEFSNFLPLKALDHLKHEQIKQFQEIYNAFVKLQLAAENPVTLAQTWAKYSPDDLIKSLLYILTNWIKYKFNLVNTSFLNIKDDVQCLQLIEQKPIVSLFEDLDTLYHYQNDLLNYSLNKLLHLEVLTHYFYSQGVK